MNSLHALAIASGYELIPPTVTDTTVTGDAVDILELEGAGLFVVDTVLGTGTTPTLDITIEHCDTDDGSFAEVTDISFTQVTGAAGAGLQTAVCNLSNLKRYVHAVATIDGTTPEFAFQVALIGMKKVAP